MSAPDASVTPTTKRTRFNFEPELSNNKNSSTTSATSATPSAAAHDVASSGILALHPTLRTIAETQLLRFMKLYSQQTRQLETIEKLNIDSFIPRSARLAFTLKASATTTETSEFTTVAASCVEYIKTVQHNLKQFILQVATLELLTIRRSIATHVINSIILLAKGSLLAVTEIDQASNHMILRLVKSCIYEREIQELLNLADIHLDTLLSTLLPTMDLLTQPQHPDDYDGQDHRICIAIQQTVQPQFQQAIRKIFCASCIQFDHTRQANKLRLRMEQFAKLHMAETTANETMMNLDLEPTAPPALLAKMIADKVKEATKTLRQEIQSLKSTAKEKTNSSTNNPNKGSSAKNTHRGATDQTNKVTTSKKVHNTVQTSPRASSTNKKHSQVTAAPTSLKKKKEKLNQRNTSVAGAVNDSTNAPKKHGKSSKQKKGSK
jgi:hypothetical protein